MSKRYNQKMKTLKESRERLVSNYCCSCPECGERDTHASVHFVGNSDVPEMIEITCGRCGSSVVEYDQRTKEYHVKRDGAPYIPESPKISVTEYYRFEPSSYPNEEDAIRAEVEMLGECLTVYATTGRYVQGRETITERSRLISRSLEIGMTDFVALFIGDITGDTTDLDTEKFENVMDRCFKAMEGCSVETKCEVLEIFYDRGMADERFDDASVRLVHDVCDDLDMIADAEEYVKNVLHTCHSIEGVGDSYRQMIIEHAISHVERIADAGTRERCLIPLYAKHITGVENGPGMDEEMEFLYCRHEAHPNEFVKALLEYGRKNVDRPEQRARISEMSTCALMMFEKNANNDKRSDMAEYSISKLHYLRYETDGDTDDLLSATEHMMMPSNIAFVFEFGKMLDECLKHPDIPSSVKDGLRRQAKEKDMSMSRFLT